MAIKKSKTKGLTLDKQLVIFSLLGVVLLIVVFGPVFSNLKQRQAGKATLGAQVKQLNTKLSTLNGVDSILVTERVKKMESVFPSRKPVVELLGTLSELSGLHNLSFGGVSLSPGSLSEQQTAVKKGAKTTISPELSDLRFGFQIGGSFGDILAFMKDLENVAPLMKIEEVGLSIRTNPLFEVDSTLVLADISVAAFYQPPPKTLGSVSQPVKLLTRSDEALLNKLINFKIFRTEVPLAQAGKEDLFQ